MWEHLLTIPTLFSGSGGHQYVPSSLLCTVFWDRHLLFRFLLSCGSNTLHRASRPVWARPALQGVKPICLFLPPPQHYLVETENKIQNISIGPFESLDDLNVNDLEIVTRGLKYLKLLLDINLDLVHIQLMKNAETESLVWKININIYTHNKIQLTTDEQCFRGQQTGKLTRNYIWASKPCLLSSVFKVLIWNVLFRLFDLLAYVYVAKKIMKSEKVVPKIIHKWFQKKIIFLFRKWIH